MHAFKEKRNKSIGRFNELEIHLVAVLLFCWGKVHSKEEEKTKQKNLQIQEKKKSVFLLFAWFNKFISSLWMAFDCEIFLWPQRIRKTRILTYQCTNCITNRRNYKMQ